MAAKKTVRKSNRKAPARGLTPADKAATIVHLTDTVGQNLAHTSTHVQMTKRGGNNPVSRKHNIQHADTHIKIAQEHVKKLQKKLAADPKYRPAIKELKQEQAKSAV